MRYANVSNFTRSLPSSSSIELSSSSWLPSSSPLRDLRTKKTPTKDTIRPAPATISQKPSGENGRTANAEARKDVDGVLSVSGNVGVYEFDSEFVGYSEDVGLFVSGEGFALGALDVIVGVGRLDGKEDGELVGAADGVLEGANDGDEEGVDVGFELGRSEGLSEGDDVGLDVGGIYMNAGTTSLPDAALGMAPHKLSNSSGENVDLISSKRRPDTDWCIRMSPQYTA